MHAVADIALYVPAEQIEQAEDSSLDDESTMYVPAGQMEQDVEAGPLKLPAGQLEHELEPASAENFPPSHLKHGPEPGLYWPAGQEREHVPTSKLYGSEGDMVPPAEPQTPASKAIPISGVPLQLGGHVEWASAPPQ